MSGTSRLIGVRRLRTSLLLLLCLLAGTAVEAGELRKQAFHSNILGRDYRYNVYLPTGYDKGARRYPVLYLLHGSGGDENEWSEKGDLRATIDGMVARGQLQPIIVVMPGHPPGWWVEGVDEYAQ
ncbi:MAG: alpha/beta hydrolase-fold protein, partial [Usitatibacteraceae bacterium]